MNLEANTNETLLKQITALKAEVHQLKTAAKELEKVKEALKLSEIKYRAAFEYTGTAMMVVSEDTTLLMANHKCEEVTGYPQVMASSGRSWTEFIDEEDLPKMMKVHEDRRKNPEAAPGEYEFKLKHKSGKTKDILLNISSIPQTDKSLISLIDITERKKAAEAKLRLAQEEADKARKIVDGLRKELAQATRFENMVSRSPQMQRIFEILPQVADSMATVLIEGDSGTGKELIAKSLHSLSPRKNQPFVAVNCGALPDNLLESELFGYKAGAFTDAKKDKPGKFALAQGGTIFLDEIGDLSLPLQVKLLRVLQEKQYEPLGATTPVQADVRIITATHRQLDTMVKNETFRNDLFYRIKVLTIKLPALKDRRCDIPILCNHFIDLFNARYKKRIKAIENSALDLLVAYDFPGNIRELENIIEHAFIFCKTDEISQTHLPPELVETQTEADFTNIVANAKSLKELEKLYIQGVLEETNGNKTLAAQKLGVHKATLFRKIKQLGVV